MSSIFYSETYAGTMPPASALSHNSNRSNNSNLIVVVIIVINIVI